MGDFLDETERQIADAVQALSRIEAISVAAWSGLDLPMRIQALQEVESVMAAVQRRPPVPVQLEELEPGVYGASDGERILIDVGQVEGSVPVDELVDTIIHEGRHAYQQFVVENPGTMTDPEIVAAWSHNLENYLEAEVYGQRRYMEQPVEADAWSYAERIRAALYGASR